MPALDLQGGQDWHRAENTEVVIQREKYKIGRVELWYRVIRLCSLRACFHFTFPNHILKHVYGCIWCEFKCGWDVSLVYSYIFARMYCTVQYSCIKTTVDTPAEWVSEFMTLQTRVNYSSYLVHIVQKFLRPTFANLRSSARNALCQL